VVWNGNLRWLNYSTKVPGSWPVRSQLIAKSVCIPSAPPALWRMCCAICKVHWRRDPVRQASREACCVRFYNSLDLHWLLYPGWAVLAVAMVLGWRARVAFQAEGGSGEGESWLHTRTVVATGV
jgi:hypothetical protein